MILKKIKRAHVNRSKRAMIGGLVNYVLARVDDDGKDKCAWSFGLNFFAATREGQRAEMIALAEEAPRSRMPVMHWLMSWNEDEIPTEQQIKEAVQMFLVGMELDGHQAIVAVHTNTQNIHAHIVVNRVHPDTCEVIQPHNGFDIEAAHKVVAVIEKIQGWEPQKKARYRVDENNQVVRNEPRKKQPPSSRAQDFENNTGEKSAQRIAQQRGRKIIEEAKTWAELHDRLKEVGLRFEKKGSGAIVFVGDIAVKASSIDRKFSMGKLCKKLGEFYPGDYPPVMPKIEPEPLTKIAEKEWREYMGTRQTVIEERKQQKKQLQKQNREKIALFKARQKVQRKEAYSGLAAYGEEFVGIAKFFLPAQQSRELAEAGKALPKMPKSPCKRFKDWLRQRSPWLADIWRLRRRLIPGKNYGHFDDGQFPKIGKLPQPLIPYIEMVKRRYADLKKVKSRLDATTALHLRCAGYRRGEVEAEIRRHSPPPAPAPGHAPDFEYLKRVLDYAFGAQGDIRIINKELTKDDVEKYNKEAEIIDYYAKYPEWEANQKGNLTADTKRQSTSEQIQQQRRRLR